MKIITDGKGKYLAPAQKYEVWDHEIPYMIVDDLKLVKPFNNQDKLKRIIAALPQKISHYNWKIIEVDPSEIDADIIQTQEIPINAGAMAEKFFEVTNMVLQYKNNVTELYEILKMALDECLEKIQDVRHMIELPHKFDPYDDSEMLGKLRELLQQRRKIKDNISLCEIMLDSLGDTGLNTKPVSDALKSIKDEKRKYILRFKPMIKDPLFNI